MPRRRPEAPTGDRLNDNNRQGDVAKARGIGARAWLLRARWAFGGVIFGLLAGAWAGGGTDRYGEDDGVLGGLRGACGTLARGYRYTAATIRECVTHDRT